MRYHKATPICKVEADFIAGPRVAPGCSQRDVIDLRIGTPDIASGNANLELAGQIIEVSIPGKLLVGLQNKR